MNRLVEQAIAALGLLRRIFGPETTQAFVVFLWELTYLFLSSTFVIRLRLAKSNIDFGGISCEVGCGPGLQYEFLLSGTERFAYYRSMKITHETSTATLIQASVMWILNVITQVQASISSCIHHDSCVSGIVINLLFVLVLGVWLMFLSALGYMAENRRSRKFATALILGEGLVAIVTFFNIRHFPNILGLVTSIVDCAMAIWIIFIAFRLRQSITTTVATAPTGQRPRRRVRPQPKK